MRNTAVQSATETRAEVAESEVASESVGPRIYVFRLTTYLTRDTTAGDPSSALEPDRETGGEEENANAVREFRHDSETVTAVTVARYTPI